MISRTAIRHLRAGGTSVLVDTLGGGAPAIRYWGPDLGEWGELEGDALVASQGVVVPSGPADVPLRVGVVPEESAGWLGEPGITLTRGGRLIPVRLATVAAAGGDGETSPYPTSGPDGQQVGAWARYDATDQTAGATVTTDLQVTPQGIVRVRVQVTNTGEDGLGVARLIPAVPLPTTLTQIVDQCGHHLRERETVTHPVTIGVYRRATRGARNHNASTILGAAAPGVTTRTGRVHYGHVEWSGNVDQWVERTPWGHLLLAGGELLMPGEGVLARGEAYSSPWVSLTWGEGFDRAAGRFHEYVRGFHAHPATPRPVTLNAWEAVYFDHDLRRLSELADVAARVGVERFVLDDGWFGKRRDAHAGLGDWQVSPEVWPDGLKPLSDHVHGLGMQFGLWFEPEMINVDSDLARAHPDWILGPAERLPLESRHQHVLNLTVPGARAYVCEAVAAVVEAAGVDYIKWDYNRDLLEPFDRIGGGYAVHEQTLAVYQVIDELHERFPALEIESCAGGGGRIDLGMMRRAQRVWASDCIDPLERQLIQAGTSLLLPGELIGSHVASAASHTTGRQHALQFRCINALFNHFGIEWDLKQASEDDLDELTAWVALYRQIRGLVSTGTVVTGVQPDDSLRVVGIVAQDRSEAYYALVQCRTSQSRPAGALTLPGLDPCALYDVTVPNVGANREVEAYPHNGAGGVTVLASASWWTEGVVVPGAYLAEAGVAAPILNPERAALIHAHRR